ncbi:hypothetical protein CCACVL1_17621 [Corchorus capsularis]|uniref:F-box domain-containing protein n=1 Tax=Corchorus capsularis TaxID=210143 RepID=A0A1R3HRE6_COCAP|nr:hypothetical protein CCACVL1_17621 [Corchorus capsularis]
METNKKIRRANKEKDRLSALPVVLILHILSFLETREAVQACMLVSKRWKDLWKCLPSLSFNSMEYFRRKLPFFKNFAQNVMERREPCHLRSLKLHTSSTDKSFRDKVLHYAKFYSVREINIGQVQIPFWENFPVNYFMSLTTLQLYDCPLVFDNDVFSACVNMETLILNDCFQFEEEVIRISAPRLVNFRMENFNEIEIRSMYRNDYRWQLVGSCHGNYCWKIVISSPRLSSLCYKNTSFQSFMLSLEQCPVLERADIIVDNSCFKQDLLKIVLQQLVTQAKSLFVWNQGNKGVEMKTSLGDDDMVHARLHNKATNKRFQLSWPATDENLGLFLVRIVRRFWAVSGEYSAKV